MKQLRKLIHSKLKTLHPRVYFQSAPEDAAFPYLVYDFTQIEDTGEGFAVASVDVDGWDMPPGGDTTALEDLMSAVDSGLYKQILFSDHITVTLYLDRKIPLTDDDKRIKRRKYIYDARIFERS